MATRPLPGIGAPPDGTPSPANVRGEELTQTGPPGGGKGRLGTASHAAHSTCHIGGVLMGDNAPPTPRLTR